MTTFLECALEAADGLQSAWPSDAQQYVQDLAEFSLVEVVVKHPALRIGVCICACRRLAQLRRTLPLLLLKMSLSPGLARAYVLIPSDEQETLEWLAVVLEAPIRMRTLTVAAVPTSEWHFGEWYNAAGVLAGSDGTTVVWVQGSMQL